MRLSGRSAWMRPATAEAIQVGARVVGERASGSYNLCNLVHICVFIWLLSIQMVWMKITKKIYWKSSKESGYQDEDEVDHPNDPIIATDCHPKIGLQCHCKLGCVRVRMMGHLQVGHVRSPSAVYSSSLYTEPSCIDNFFRFLVALAFWYSRIVYSSPLSYTYRRIK